MQKGNEELSEQIVFLSEDYYMDCQQAREENKNKKADKLRGKWKQEIAKLLKQLLPSKRRRRRGEKMTRSEWISGYNHGTRVSMERMKEKLLEISNEKISENLYKTPQAGFDHAIQCAIARCNQIMRHTKEI